MKTTQELTDKIKKIERNYSFVRDIALALERLESWAANSTPEVSHGIKMAIKEIQGVVDHHVE